MTWHTALLSEVADLSLGKMLDKAKNKGEASPYLANINVRWGNFDLEDLRTMRFEAHEVERYSLKAGDIVMCEGGEPGRCALWSDQNQKMMLQKALHRIRPKQQINSTYLYYYFLNTGKHNGFTPYFTGATIKHLPREQLAKIPIRFPCKTLQKKIGATLSSYDNLIATNQRRIALLEEAARLIYREWFVNLRFPGHESTHISTGIPEGWKSGSAHEFINILSGGTPKTSINNYWDGDIPFFTPKDSPNCFYTTDTEKSLTSEGLNNCNSRLFPKETIFITARGTVGKTALSGRPMAMNQSCYALTPKEGIGNLFLFMAIRENISRLQKAANGGVFNAIVVDTFKHIPFLAPKPELTLAFDDKVRPLFEQVLALIQQNRILAQARDLLLPKLMSGQIDVSNIQLPDEDVVT